MLPAAVGIYAPWGAGKVRPTRFLTVVLYCLVRVTRTARSKGASLVDPHQCIFDVKAHIFLGKGSIPSDVHRVRLAVRIDASKEDDH